jgi:CHAT domain-containing protein
MSEIAADWGGQRLGPITVKTETARDAPQSLLVSHWAVDSAATVRLITTAMREMASGSKPGRAEALRRAMLALIDNGDLREAHPAYWAPFIVVGEGAR